MANPQTKNGHTQIANEITDHVLRRNFTKRQGRILKIIWRFSYGFRKKEAYFPSMKTFSMFGISPQAISKELKTLESLKVISVNWDEGIIKFNKDYDQWGIPVLKNFNDGDYKHLMRLNLKPSERPASGWNKSRHGGGREPAEHGSCDKIVKDMLYSDKDIKTLYTAYLSTRHWKFTRNKKIASVGDRCEECAQRGDLLVHHLHYETLGRELDKDLLVLCPSCHKKDHYKTLLSPITAIGSQRHNPIGSHEDNHRLSQSKPFGSLEDNLKVNSKITEGASNPNVGNSLQPPKESRKKVDKKSPDRNVNLFTKRDAIELGMYIDKEVFRCYQRANTRHEQIIYDSVNKYSEKIFVDKIREAKKTGVDFTEAMEWVGTQLGV